MRALSMVAGLVVAHATAPVLGSDRPAPSLFAGWTRSQEGEEQSEEQGENELTLGACQEEATGGVPADLDLEAGPHWGFSISVFYSDPPGSEDRVTPILSADRGALHLEARYNYEDLETTSLFAGGTLGVGGEEEGDFEFALTPMVGGAFGKTEGIVPALELDLGWRRISWYAEIEYLFDLEDKDDDFFYSWSTLTFSFTDWLSAGLVMERSKLVDTDFSVQPGLALELSWEHVGVSLYAYDLGSDDFYAAVALELAL